MKHLAEWLPRLPDLFVTVAAWIVAFALIIIGVRVLWYIAATLIPLALFG